MYQALGIRDPAEFGALPPEVQRFWNAWLIERVDRGHDTLSDIRSQIDDVNRQF